VEVVLLGTGAADGWPNAFCACDSCAEARRSGVLRSPTTALVDDVLLLECGSEAGSAAARQGRSLAGVRHVLVTHAHSDHLAPELLLHRSWVTDAPLDVVGPSAVIEACRPWVAPDAPVRWVPVEAGDVVELDGYRVRALPANHRVLADGDSVLYDITAPDGSRLLWACDTGPWAEDWFAAVEGAAYDVVLLEETFGDRTDLDGGHLDLVTFSELVARLRDAGAVTGTTEVVAVHLSHHNPPEPELVDRLAAVGARPGRDGERLTLR
jgi:adenosylcobinamide kinase/adenosylcobinamide-phosphate guanylyltransferase